MTVTPLLPPNASDPLKLTIQFTRTGEANGSQSVIVETRDQQPVVIDVPGTVDPSKSSIIITPYLLKNQAELLQLFKCKEKARVDATRRQ